jgi:hypothetical protein
MILSSSSWGITFRLLVLLQLVMTSSMLWAQTIVVLADTPYSSKETEMLQGPNGILYQLINKAKPSVVMHLGDFKSGSKSCTDDLLKAHKTLFNQVYPGKTIYTPGDNDWTDCDRNTLSQRFDELNRLDFLIKLMYQTPPLLDKDLTSIKAQSEQVENKLWINDRLAVSTIHLVGTSNGRAHIEKSSLELALKTVDKRDKLNLAWLNKIEEKAEDYDALIIGFQADIYQQEVLQSGVCDRLLLKKCDAFTLYRQAFKVLAKRINKPVLISHGDTGDFCFEKIDKNLWHLNAAGDVRYIDATKVTFNKKSIKQPFTVSGLINTHLPHTECHN